MRPPQERQRPAGRQRHLPWSSRVPGIHPRQPALRKLLLQIPPGVHQSTGRLGEVCLLRVVLTVAVSCDTGTAHSGKALCYLLIADARLLDVRG